MRCIIDGAEERGSLTCDSPRKHRWASHLILYEYEGIMIRILALLPSICELLIEPELWEIFSQ
jgi:hypothetical protein